jgi:HSP20 family protein
MILLLKMMQHIEVTIKNEPYMEHYSSKSSIHYIYPGEYTPLPELEQLANELKLHREGTVVQPLMNVRDSAKSFIVEVAIPGVKRENFLLAVSDQVLSIALFVKNNIDIAVENFHLHDFNYECFDRHILLPDNVNPQLASATYKEGLLHIYIPKEAMPLKTEALRIVVY